MGGSDGETAVGPTSCHPSTYRSVAASASAKGPSNGSGSRPVPRILNPLAEPSLLTLDDGYNIGKSESDIAIRIRKPVAGGFCGHRDRPFLPSISPGTFFFFFFLSLFPVP
ncbi:hypothetical protein B296_00004053 [Ensete ventricosum]|uniref:Uncharacterized protein n=1 Tax=Ensete ventricosum TaxID=4639 RepID=A0A427A7H3_ENSVE|nr:hypothetical protein B296_00004053 [Ensete ventricosum]